MKKSLMLILWIGIFLVGCDNTEHETNIYSLKNNLGEEYVIKYTEYAGFPDTNVNITIYYLEKEIIKYNGEYKKIDQLKPQKLLLLFSTENSDFYFLENEYSNYIFIAGQIDWEFQDNKVEITQDYIESELFEINKEGYFELSKKLQDNIDETTLIEKFEMCGYNYSEVINIYNLSPR